MLELKKKLAQLLYDKSYKEGQFTLTSGKKSDYYFDCKQTALHPAGSYFLGKILFSMIQKLPEPVSGVGGMTLGADPLVSAVTVISYLEGNPLPGFIVRKKPKKHGTAQFLEGLANFSQGNRVCLLEDVITTGGSVLTAATRVQEAGLEVKDIICVLDREEGGKQTLEQKGYRFYSIFTRQELLDLVKK
ncbi:MAG: orotate phosphoribosyltransferase [Desulfonauticus sp.]|nr:orotate phosphoribosyltransferase [Desulfonauticus sp.]